MLSVKKSRLFVECVSLFLLITFCNGDNPPEILKDPSFLQLLSKHFSSGDSPHVSIAYDAEPNYQYGAYRYRPQEDSNQYSNTIPESSSYGYDYRQGAKSPVYTAFGGSTTKNQQYPVSSQGLWNPAATATATAASGSSNLWTVSNYSYNQGGYSARPTSAGMSYSQPIRFYGNEPLEGSFSQYQFQQPVVRPTTAPAANYVSVKKSPLYYNSKRKIVKIVEPGMKLKYKKSGNPVTYYKKVVRVQSPFAKHKYPIKKTVMPAYYKKYYQTPYSNYKSPVTKVNQPYGYYKYPEMMAAAATTTITTTMMPETKMTTPTIENSITNYTYSDKPYVYEDYTNYNDTYYKNNRVSNYTYEVYEDAETATSETNENLGYEATTRGYYGDRVYMSTQGPVNTLDQKDFNRYYIVRNEARDESDDDIETIFE